MDKTIVRNKDGKFGKGNRSGGRTAGIKDRLSKYREVCDEDFEALISKVMEMALAGDLGAAKLIMDRMWALPTQASLSLESEVDDLIGMIEGLTSDDSVNLKLVD